MEILFVIVLGIISIMLIILMLIASYNVFLKFSEPGWYAFIPVFSEYIYYKHCWKSGWFWPAFTARIGGAVLFLLSGGETVERLAGRADQYSILQYAARIAVLLDLQRTLPQACMTAVVIILIIAAGINLYRTYMLSRSFDHGFAFAAGLFFLPFIFLPILGFGRNEYYIGPGGKHLTAPEEDRWSCTYL